MATPSVFQTKFLLSVFFACCCTALLQAQSLDIDYDGSNNNEKILRIKVIKSLGAGVNSYGVVEVSTEALSIDAYFDRQVHMGLSMFSNYTLFGGDLLDLATRASHLHYPYGGTVNGQLQLDFPIARPINPLRFIAFGGGRLLNSGIIMPRNESSYYSAYTAGIGFHQQLKSWENQDKSNSGFFWAQPSLHQQWMRAADSDRFYIGHMATAVWSWGLQAGLEVNRKLRLTLFVSQYLSKQELQELNNPQLRLNFSYRFVPRPKKIQLLELDRQTQQ